MAAPLLVVAGVALFAIGAGGIAGVNGALDAASSPAGVRQPRPDRALDAAGLPAGVRQPQPRPDRALDVRDDHPRPPHRGRF